MNRLDTMGAAKLETHLGHSVPLLLSFLSGIGRLLIGKDILKEGEGTNVGENAILHGISRSCEDLCLCIKRAQRCLCC